MLLFVFLLPAIASAAAVYAMARHDVDQNWAFGIAAVATFGFLLALSGQAANVNDIGTAGDVFTSPAKLADAFSEVIGFGPTLGLIVGGGAVGFFAAQARSRPSVPNKPPPTTQAPNLSGGPAAKPPARPARPAPPPAASALLRLPEEPPTAPTSPASQAASQAAVPSKQRLTVCPACLQLFEVGEVRLGRCPHCNAEVDI